MSGRIGPNKEETRMRSGTLVTVIVTVVLLGLIGGGIAADQQGGKQPEMTPAQKAAMDAWMKVATPGEGHKVLEPMIGSWNAAITMWEGPGAPPQQSVGTG